MKTLCLGMGRNMLKVNFDPKGPRNSVKHIQSLAYVRRFTSLHTLAKSCVYFFFFIKKKKIYFKLFHRYNYNYTTEKIFLLDKWINIQGET